MKKIILYVVAIWIVFSANNPAFLEASSSRILDYSCEIVGERINTYANNWQGSYTAVGEIKYTRDGDNELYVGVKKDDGKYSIVLNRQIIGNYSSVIAYAFAEFGNAYYYVTKTNGKEDLYINGKYRGSYAKIEELTFGYFNNTYLAKIVNDEGKYQVISNAEESTEYDLIDSLMINYSGSSSLFTAKYADGEYVYVKDGIESLKYKSLYPVYGGSNGDSFISVYNENEFRFYTIDNETSTPYDSLIDLANSPAIQPYVLLIRESNIDYLYLNGVKSNAFPSITDMYTFKNYLYYAGRYGGSYFCQRSENTDNKEILQQKKKLSKSSIEGNSKHQKFISKIDIFIEGATEAQLEEALSIIIKSNDLIMKTSYKNVFNYFEAVIELKLIQYDHVDI